ncbi:hypothetical protein C6Y14_42420 [Streptomyces dioscori]|uniref:Uncharacterized protein n=1 Tax=Streptomyces dioscori TaxID=2109333 RepID=A0A2P8PTQ9_9ACTN|nr:hypothetical protein C6Y14_42420 [Streptomyces dioscori]
MPPGAQCVGVAEEQPGPVDADLPEFHRLDGGDGGGWGEGGGEGRADGGEGDGGGGDGDHDAAVRREDRQRTVPGYSAEGHDRHAVHQEAASAAFRAPAYPLSVRHPFGAGFECGVEALLPAVRVEELDQMRGPGRRDVVQRPAGLPVEGVGRGVGVGAGDQEVGRRAHIGGDRRIPDPERTRVHQRR